MNYAIGEAVSLAQLLVWECSRMRGRAFAHNYRDRALKYRDHARYAKFLYDFAQQGPLYILSTYVRLPS